MVARFLRMTGTAFVMAVALVTPVLATATAKPASADTVIDGCTIVANPTPTNFTNCPGVNLSGALLAGANLSYANLTGAQLAGNCVLNLPSVECQGAILDEANLSGADLSNASFVFCTELDNFFVGCASPTLIGADLTDANLAGATLAGCIGPFVFGRLACSSPNMSGANLSDADLTGAVLEACPLGVGNGFPCGSPNLSGADLTGTLFIPSNKTVPTMSSGGAVVTYSIPTSLIAATPTSCSPPSGSTFSIGTTTVACTVFDDQGDEATGTFTLTVQGAADLLASLLLTVTNTGPGASLADKVQAAQAAVAAGLPAQAIAELNALINEVRAQAGKKLTPTQATSIVAAATHVINVLST
jgi:uncharacterized protein YjbI with pentapeptide repeats